MPKPIKRGDMVYVKYPSLCCKSDAGIGKFFTVAEVVHGGLKCGNCLHIRHRNIALVQDGGLVNDLPLAFEVERLARIDPQQLKDDVPHKADLGEPAQKGYAYKSDTIFIPQEIK